MKNGLTRRNVLGLPVGLALAHPLVAIGQPSDCTGSDQDMIPAIDTHIHVVPPGVPGGKPEPEDVVALYNGPLDLLADRVKKEMKQAGVKVAFGMGSAGTPETDPLGIQSTLALCNLVPGLMAVAIADPRCVDPAHLKAVESQIESNRGKVVAFKAYLGYLHFGPEHPSYIPYYKLAAKYDLPVIVHTGDNWSTTAKLKYAHPLRMDEVAVDHPEVRFALAHFGYPWLVDAAEVVFKNPNVWADLSGIVVGTLHFPRTDLDHATSLSTFSSRWRIFSDHGAGT